MHALELLDRCVARYERSDRVVNACSRDSLLDGAQPDWALGMTGPGIVLSVHRIRGNQQHGGRVPLHLPSRAGAEWSADGTLAVSWWFREAAARERHLALVRRLGARQPVAR